MECQYCCYYLVFLAGLLCYCVIATEWPVGIYGLPMAKTGCPAGATFRWKTGWVYQDTENDNPQNSKSASFHLEGEVKLSSVNRSFCMKTAIEADSDHRNIWHPGTYCIYEGLYMWERHCPARFTKTPFIWYDEVDNNKNEHQGTLPYGAYREGKTTICFCCRHDGLKTVPIDLPTTSPFYLLTHRDNNDRSCQQVRWAVATSEWIYYDTEDDIYGKYLKNKRKKEADYKEYYCYYTSCQYSLNTSTGSFESPRFPANYPNGQECSWKISVKASQTIFVHFLNFSLADIGDSLMFYDGTDDTAPLLTTLHGRSDIPRVLRSTTSNLFVVFHSNEIGISSGFKVIYATAGTSTVLPPASSTQAPTTTKETTKTTEVPVITTETQVVTEKTKRPETVPLSHIPLSKPSSEPSSLPKENSSKNYDSLKKTYIQQNQSTLTVMAIVISLICLIAVIAMAVYLFILRSAEPRRRRYGTVTEERRSHSSRLMEENRIEIQEMPADAATGGAKKEFENPLYESEENLAMARAL